MRVAILVVAVAVLAGCSTLPAGPDGTAAVGSPNDAVATTTATTEPTPSASRTTTVAETAASTTAVGTDGSLADTRDSASADNPWGERTVSVALVRNGHDETDYRRALTETFDYWDRHAVLADYRVEFEVVEGDPAEADVRVVVQDEVGSCGYDQGDALVGCAPLIESGTTPERPATVRVEAGFDRRSTRSIMIHEFGHVLGVEHGERPEMYMTGNTTLFTVERPDATDRAYPWGTDDFRVYIDTTGLPDDETAETREQVRHAVEYYNGIRRDHDGVPSNVTLELVESPARANVVVSFPDTLPCGASQGSCGGRFGAELDGDGDIEYYNRLNVTMTGVEPAARGWHVGYWFGRSLGLAESELPAPFVDAGYEDIRSAWWTEEP